MNNTMNRYKAVLSAERDVVKAAGVAEFQPLKSWPAVSHPQQQRLEEFRQTPSWKPK